jgi:UDP-N-acetylmuramoyl-L-alanyl-D-glutamate--2,6-diaminopimelate ligase
MNLKKLLQPLPEEWIIRSTSGDPDIVSVTCDSRKVSAGTLFFAIKGLISDGHRFIPDAIGSGAVAVISENFAPEGIQVPWIQVSSIRKVMATCSDFLLDHPSRKVNLTGVTGTNGKTTVAHIIHSILSIKSPALLMGTVKTVLGSLQEEASLTTPESVELHRLLDRAAGMGIKHGVMEVSSHALAYDRVFGMSFPTAVFTNLTTDHLDFHRDMEDYFSVKGKLFDLSYNRALNQSVVNIDDPFGARLARTIPSGILSYGMHAGADIFPEDSTSSIEGISLLLKTPWGRFHVESALCGNHNIYNIMAAFGAALAQNISPDQAAEGIRALRAVPGRFQRLELDRPWSVVLDYAHTPDALKNVLSLARSVCEHRVIAVFGCGGDRDRTKRPEMARIGVSNSDIAIITSDNPRTEDPEKIIEDMVSGLTGEIRKRNWEAITDRKAAIARALDLAEKGDLVLLAGKGHENYQVLGTQKVPFDEKLIVEEILCSG